MKDHPERPATPDGNPSDVTLTAPGSPPPVPEMFTPSHGRGKLYRGGKVGNAGGGRHPTKLVELCVIVLGLSLDKLVERLQDPTRRFTTAELRLIIAAVSPYVLPSRIEHSGPMGGPIPVEEVQSAVGERLRQRLQTRELLLHPPASAPSTPPPEPPHGVASAAL